MRLGPARVPRLVFQSGAVVSIFSARSPHGWWRGIRRACVRHPPLPKSWPVKGADRVFRMHSRFFLERRRDQGLSKGLGCLPDRVPRLIGLRRQRANVSKPEVGLPCLSLIMIFVKPTCSQQHASLAAHRNQDPAVWASGQAARLPCEGCGVGAETVPAPSSHTPTRTVLADGNFRCCVVWSVCSGQLRPPQKPSLPSPSEPPRPLIADH